MSKLFKQQAAYLIQENKKFTSELVMVFGAMPYDVISAWRSNRFLVTLYRPANGAQRITINRTMVDTGTGHWVDGITWQEIQNIKSAIGFADHDAVEVYPADRDVVNVANMRHIWLVDRLDFAWRKP